MVGPLGTTDERDALVQAAGARKTTFNGFVTWLIFSALEQEKLLDAKLILDDAVGALKPLVENVNELAVSGDLRREVHGLKTLLRALLETGEIRGDSGEAIRGHLDGIDKAERVVERELGRRLGRIRTDGGPR